jgi:uncharacterized Zn finger protein (UPF0148 family)
MSDFDKEAERERLREKYEQEQREREATEKMSELLLQGATMTNAHCSDCGDPIFRYEDQEFCATCEKAVDRGSEDADADDAESNAGQGSEDAENIEVTSPDDESRVAFGGENVDAEANGEQSPAPEQSADTQPQPTDSPRQQSPPPEQQTPGDQPSPSQPSRQRQPTRDVPSVDPGANGDVSAARESLVRTLTRFSQQAEATEDPRQAQEYLAAAREAAEALSALRR